MITKDKLSTRAKTGPTVLCGLFLFFLLFAGETSPLAQERMDPNEECPPSQTTLHTPSASQTESLLYDTSGSTTYGDSEGVVYKIYSSDIQLYEHLHEEGASYRMEYTFSVTASDLLHNFTMISLGFMGAIESEIYYCVLRLDWLSISTLNIVGNQISGQFTVSLPERLDTIFYIESLVGTRLVNVRGTTSPSISVNNLESFEDHLHIYFNGWKIETEYSLNQINDDPEQYQFSSTNSLQKMTPWENGDFSSLSQLGFLVGIFNESRGNGGKVYPFVNGFSDNESIYTSNKIPDDAVQFLFPVTNVEYLILGFIFSDDGNQQQIIKWEIHQIPFVIRYSVVIWVIGITATVGLCSLKYKPLKILPRY